MIYIVLGLVDMTQNTAKIFYEGHGYHAIILWCSYWGYVFLRGIITAERTSLNVITIFLIKWLYQLSVGILCCRLALRLLPVYLIPKTRFFLPPVIALSQHCHLKARCDERISHKSYFYMLHPFK